MHEQRTTKREFARDFVSTVDMYVHCECAVLYRGNETVDRTWRNHAGHHNAVGHREVIHEGIPSAISGKPSASFRYADLAAKRYSDHAYVFIRA